MPGLYILPSIRASAYYELTNSLEVFSTPQQQEAGSSAENYTKKFSKPMQVGKHCEFIPMK